MNFKKGMEVECIEPNTGGGLNFGGIYTVARVSRVKNIVYIKGIWRGFSPVYFRDARYKKQAEIDAFWMILDHKVNPMPLPEKKKEDVRNPVKQKMSFAFRVVRISNGMIASRHRSRDLAYKARLRIEYRTGAAHFVEAIR